jgi:hypothetical protein
VATGLFVPAVAAAAASTAAAPTASSSRPVRYLIIEETLFSSPLFISALQEVQVGPAGHG